MADERIVNALNGIWHEVRAIHAELKGFRLLLEQRESDTTGDTQNARADDNVS